MSFTTPFVALLLVFVLIWLMQTREFYRYAKQNPFNSLKDLHKSIVKVSQNSI